MPVTSKHLSFMIVANSATIANSGNFVSSDREISKAPPPTCWWRETFTARRPFILSRKNVKCCGLPRVKWGQTRTVEDDSAADGRRR